MSCSKRTIFTLASARSGTLYLKSLFQKNTRNCACRHEPFFDWGNPTFFGPAIYDAYAGRLDRLRKRMAKKHDYVQHLPGDTYLESSHAVLKSAYRVALEFFPDLRLIHLIRDPLRVARSEAWRETWRRRFQAPFHFYKGEDGRRHFAWALTGNEEIFRTLSGRRLSLFEWYLVQWIEIENRAMRFLDENHLHDRCFALQTAELNDPSKVREMFDFLALPPARDEVFLEGRKNRSFGYSSVVTDEETNQWSAILHQLPSHYLEIFHREPYVSCEWWGRRFEKEKPLINAALL
ncbi:MAG: hypothetical protein C5B50_16320 [Verrucomicrobia bacterium]|nr:MAG: hypothetical protein C5B50_16320 [Verrucomicrobiota bacterium]